MSALLGKICMLQIGLYIYISVLLAKFTSYIGLYISALSGIIYMFIRYNLHVT